MRTILLALMLTLPTLAAASAEAKDEAARSLARWEANRRTNATVAYEAGRDFLKRSPPVTEARPVRAWIEAHDKVSAAARKPMSSADEAMTFLRENVQGTRTILESQDSRQATIDYGAFALEGCTFKSHFTYDARFLREAGERREMTLVIDLRRVDPKTIRIVYEASFKNQAIFAGSLKPAEPAFASDGRPMAEAVPVRLDYPFLAEPIVRALKVLASHCGNR